MTPVPLQIVVKFVRRVDGRVQLVDHVRIATQARHRRRGGPVLVQHVAPFVVLVDTHPLAQHLDVRVVAMASIHQPCQENVIVAKQARRRRQVGSAPLQHVRQLVRWVNGRVQMVVRIATQARHRRRGGPVLVICAPNVLLVDTRLLAHH